MVPADRWMDHGGLKKQLSASRCAESEVSSSNVVKCERATKVKSNIRSLNVLSSRPTRTSKNSALNKFS